jgi:DNA-binding transcriptional ArsR family regulator
MFTGERERLARRLVGTIADPARLAIVRALRRTPLAASDLALVVGRTRSAASQHLRVLREVEAVVAERHGNVIRYRLGDTTAAQVLADVAEAFDRLAA